MSSLSTASSAAAASATASSLSTFTTSSATSALPSTTVAGATPTTSDPDPAVTGSISPGNAKYQYYGCWNETTSINGTGGRRALYGGSMEALDTMTVSTCLAYCGVENFQYAGLEYASECWCSQYISVFAPKLADSECNFACKGNTSEICGGSLKLSLYSLKNTTGISRAAVSRNVPTTLFIVGLVVLGLIQEMS